MNLYLNISDIKNNVSKEIDICDNIRYLYPKKNTIMQGEFTKILYSKDYVTINGLYLYLPISVERKSSYENNHTRYICNISSNIQLIQDLSNIEKNILANYKIYKKTRKRCEYVLNKQLMTKQIRVYHDNNYNKKKTHYVIKISGIWETIDSIGVTYKILEL